MELTLMSGAIADVDEQDYEVLSKFNWTERKDKVTSYAVRTEYVDGLKRSVSMHRSIMGVGYGDRREVDHKDGNGLNNTRDNLRISTRQQNNRNRKKFGSTSTFRGVSNLANCARRRGEKIWLAQICLQGGRSRYIGQYRFEETAALAYNEAAKKHFGEFAKLNILPTLAVAIQPSNAL